MRNYNILSQKLEEYSVDFIKKLTLGFNKVQTKFIVDMVNGISTSNSVILSEIARCIRVDVNIKKSV